MRRLHPVRNLWKHYSGQALLAVVALGALAESLPELAAYLPGWLVTGIAILGLAGKLVKQADEDDVERRRRG